MRRQRAAGVRRFRGGNLGRRARGHDLAAAGAAFGPQVDDPIGRLDDVQIVLDDQHGVAGIDKVVQHLQQQLDIGKVQAGGRLVEQVQRLAGAFFHQLAGQLDALSLAARERGRRLAELQIVEPDVVQRLQLVANLGNVFEVGQRLLHVHFEHFGDRFALEANLQRFAIEAVPLAHRAGDPHVGQKIHFELVRAVALAGLAAAPRDVEAEAAGLVAAGLRFGKLRVELANLVEQLDVRGRVRARRAADRRLIDGDQLVELRRGLRSARVCRASLRRR